MTLHTAKDAATGETFRFRRLAALVQRLGGDDWQLVHEDAWNPPLRRVRILHKLGDGQYSVIRTLLIETKTFGYGEGTA